MLRPLPPEHLHEVGYELEPALELSTWVRETFIVEHAPLLNPEHEHLRAADIGCLWTNVEYRDGLFQVQATAELVRISGKPWPQARMVDYLCMLFGKVPDFILTFFAPGAVAATDTTFCARTEHELYHCGQKLDQENLPKFTPEGKPVWAIRRHDVEEFVGVNERYGIEACAGRSKEFVLASQRPPLIAPAQVASACGTCVALR